jgi:hypothetical protein
LRPAGESPGLWRASERARPAEGLCGPRGRARGFGERASERASAARRGSLQLIMSAAHGGFIIVIVFVIVIFVIFVIIVIIVIFIFLIYVYYYLFILMVS